MAANDLQSLVAARVERLEKDGKIAFFPQNHLFERILKNPAPGGGSSIQASITVASPTASVSNTALVPANQTAVEVYDNLNFSYQYITQDFPLSEVEMKQISNAAQATNYLDMRIQNGTRGIKNTIDLGAFTGDGSGSTLAGFPSFWEGLTYGGLTRTDYASTLGASTKYQEPAASANDAALVLSALYKAYFKIAEAGDEPDVIVISRELYAKLIEAVANKVALADWGMVKSATPTGKELLTFQGAQVVYSTNVPADQAFILNTNYIMVPSVAGYTMDRVTPRVVDSTKYNNAKEVQMMVSGRIITSAVTKHAWIVFDGV